MGKRKNRGIDIILISIVLLSIVLNMSNIWKDDYVNPYYTAAVKSMLESFHNFFFVSFDGAGYVTVDKPPVTLWIQTISAYIFGYHGWAVILPQALAGIGSVILMYILIKPSFGRGAARLASLVMACTPIVPAVSRTNNVDALLVFTLLLATWLLFQAIRRDKFLWLLGSFAVVGIGFNIKMLQAYMVLPAFYLVYWLASKINWKRKISSLSGATAILLVVSISWAVIVDNIPKEKRPYIGSSQTNSVLELAFGYNGLSRLTGEGSPVKGNNALNGMPDAGEMKKMQEQMQKSGTSMPTGGMPGAKEMKKIQEQMQKSGMSMPAGGVFGTGEPGPLRLFQSGLSGQISWLLLFVLFASISLLSGIRKGQRFTNKEKETLFWFSWLVPGVVFFSVAGFFHQYYLIMIAPPIAALTGMGWVTMTKMYREKVGWKQWLLPIAIILTTLLELYIILPQIMNIGISWIVGVGLGGILATVILVFKKKRQTNASSFITLGSLLILLITPLYWSATPLLYGGNSMLPEAGPQLKTSINMRNMGMGEKPDSKTIQYLNQNNNGETYLFATTNANTAAPYIIETGKPVMAMGGYLGSDPIMSVKRLKTMIANGEVKYFLMPSFTMGGKSDVEEWIRKNGEEIPKKKWKSKVSDSPMNSMLTLYKLEK